MKRKTLKIAHFGTFDVDNYGDLLFPHIAEFRLPNFNWEHISPTAGKTVFTDGKEIISFEMAKKNKYDAVITGGGNIINLKPNNKTVYNGIKGLAYANLWVGAAKLAADQKIPYILNSPGISKNFEGRLQEKVAAATFKNANYLAFREIYSWKIAAQLLDYKNNESKELKVVPDTALDIDKMWPIDNSQEPNFIAVNLNPRYHEPIKETVFYLEKISEALKMPIKFVVIGACHGDYDFTLKVSKELKSENYIFNSTNLKESAHLIGNAKYFIGSSMHAFITALSYQVPALLVLHDQPMHKFKGLLEIGELSSSVICNSFEDSLNKLETPALLTKDVKINIQKKLDEHWKNIDEIINRGTYSRRNIYIKNFERLLTPQLKLNEFLSKTKKIFS